ncbi:MAG TPA: hypothetical protein VFV66_37620, partial [Nonomuraea sp.]|nr:hypothetical protein [Nonomuraea sp.]
MSAVAHRPARRIWDDLATLRSRFCVRFSPSGATAAAVVADGRGAAYVESWTFGPGHRCEPLLDTWTPASSLEQSGAPADVVPFDDGRVLLLRRHPGRHEVLVAHRDGGLRMAGVLEYPDVAALPAPDGTGRALLICRRPDGQADLWRLDDLAGAPRRTAGLPASPLLVGGGFLDPRGRSFALNVRDGDQVRP